MSPRPTTPARLIPLAGALALLSLFLWLLVRGFLRIARYAPDPLGLLLAVGFTTMIVLYGFIHAGVACGLLPVTGLPMPFVSYGTTTPSKIALPSRAT